MAASKVRDQYYFYARHTIRETARRLEMENIGIYEGRNEYDEPDNVATQATDWLERWLDMFKQPNDATIVDGTCDCSYCRAIRETKIKEQADKAAVKEHKEEFDKAIDLLLSFDTNKEPTEFQGFSFKLEPVEPDLNTDAVNKWLRERANSHVSNRK